MQDYAPGPGPVSSCQHLQKVATYEPPAAPWKGSVKIQFIGAKRFDQTLDLMAAPRLHRWNRLIKFKEGTFLHEANRSWLWRFGCADSLQAGQAQCYSAGGNHRGATANMLGSLPIPLLGALQKQASGFLCLNFLSSLLKLRKNVI